MSDFDSLHQQLHDKLRSLPIGEYSPSQARDLEELVNRMTGIIPVLKRIDELLKRLEQSERVKAAAENIQFTEPPNSHG